MPLPFQFNPMDHEDLSSFVKLPVGEFPAVITDFGIHTNENSGNQSLKLVGKCEHGEFADYLNVWHESETTNRIAHQKLAAYCKAAGVFDLGPNGDEIERIFNIPVTLHVREQKNDPNRTEIYKVTAFAEQIASAPAKAAPARTSAPPRATKAATAPAPAATAPAENPWASVSTPAPAPAAAKPAGKMPWE